jgi:hypothetical protein
MSELADKSKALYDHKLRPLLEPAEMGKYVAIEPDSERYFIDADGTKALLEARRTLPDKLFFLIRIGYGAAHSIGGYGYQRNR